MDLLERVRREREERLAHQRLTLAVPTWGGDLAATYHVIERSDLQRLQEGKEQALDFLARACDHVSVRDNGDLVPVERDGVQVAFDRDLGLLLGAGDEVAGDSRALIRYLFGDNDVAIGAHAMKVLGWMQDTSQEVEGALVGESVATRSSASPAAAPGSTPTAS